jgi:hypothetical protein
MYCPYDALTSATLGVPVAMTRPPSSPPSDRSMIISGFDDVEIVLDHHQRAPGLQRLLEGRKQLRDVVEV